MRADEDPRQLKKYYEWLTANLDPHAALHSLTRSPDPKLDLAKCGVEAQHSWLEVFRCLQNIRDNGAQSSEAENNLITSFCEYLELEGIAMSYKVKELQNCQKAVNAAGALHGLFDQIAQELEKHDGITAKAVVDLNPGKDSYLRVGRESWKEKFGNPVHPWRIYLWFLADSIDSPSEPPFQATLHLWCKPWKDDWRFMQPRLRRWHASLKKRWSVCQHNWTQWDENVAPDELSASTLQVSVERVPNDKVLRAGRWLKLNEEDLVALLSKNIRQWVKELDDLP